MTKTEKIRRYHLFFWLSNLDCELHAKYLICYQFKQACNTHMSFTFITIICPSYVTENVLPR